MAAFSLRLTGLSLAVCLVACASAQPETPGDDVPDDTGTGGGPGTGFFGGGGAQQGSGGQSATAGQGSGGTTQAGGSTQGSGGFPSYAGHGGTATAGATSNGGSPATGGTVGSAGKAGSPATGGTTSSGGKAGSTSNGGSSNPFGGGTSSGGSTSTGGSTSSGGSSTTDPCTSCAMADCGTQYDACGTDPSCATLAGCVANCNGSSSCEQTCASAAGQTALDEYNALGTCLCQASTCQTQCGCQSSGTGGSGGTTGDPAAQQACVQYETSPGPQYDQNCNDCISTACSAENQQAGVCNQYVSGCVNQSSTADEYCMCILSQPGGCGTAVAAYYECVDQNCGIGTCW